MHYLGHSENGSQAVGVPESLADHLRRVQAWAVPFGRRLGLAGPVEAASLLHDLGKYGDRFQQMLARERASAGDHATAGALVLLQATGEIDGDGEIDWPELAAVAVAFHHGRLGKLDRRQALADQYIATLQTPAVTDHDVQRLLSRWADDGFAADGQRLIQAEWIDGDHDVRADRPAAAMLDARMLFSCLVDADYLATEGHFDGDAATPYRPRSASPGLDFAAAADRVQEVVDSLERNSATPMQSVRDDLFANCWNAAAQPPGPFTLVAPTGAGKTLSMLAFAFRHAATHGLDRVVIVMPFLSIIEQTVGVVRDLLRPIAGYDPAWVLEDHSLADVSARTGGLSEADVSRRGRQAENWDAPIVLTSSVRCLESLHSSRPSACRRLHRLGRAVLLFDEVQAIPPALASLTLATLSHLADRDHGFGSTVVFATATQPAFEMLDPDDEQAAELAAAGLRDDALPRVRDWSVSGWRPRPIVTDAHSLFDRAAGRVTVRWQEQAPVDWRSLAADMVATGRSALAIVNLKRHAIALHGAIGDLVPDGGDRVVHLSTSMCPRHRRDVLEAIKTQPAEVPVRCVATQCIEAGVDISFADAWRAMAPLDSIAQAAGRCNRSGEFGDSVLTVFSPAAEDGALIAPTGYGNGMNTLAKLLVELRQSGELPTTDLLNNPDLITEYYARLYTRTEDATPSNALLKAVRLPDLSALDDAYRLITGEPINILVPYDRAAYAELLQEREDRLRDPQAGWISQWIAAARDHAVGLYTHQFDRLRVVLEPLPLSREERDDEDRSSWWTLLPDEDGRYAAAVGLKVAEEDDPSLFVV